jgi:serine/threonine-protein kinase
VGTLAYMAPEQAEGLDASEPADVYSLALTLYECWTGFNPVARDTPAQTAREIGNPIPSVLEYRPDLPAHLAECLDACLDPDPELRPGLDDLDHHLDASIPRLDAAGAVPARSDAAEPRPAREHAALLRVGQLAALCAWGVGTALVAVAANRPGLALVLGMLTAPAILVASWLPWAGIPVIAPLLGAASAGAAYPAVAGSRGTIRERLVLGALGWYWMLCGAATLGLGSAGGLVDDPPHDWTRSTSAAAKALLGPLLAPEAVLGAAIFGAAAALLGLVLRAGHVAVALVGALLWAAGLEAALRLVADGALAGTPLLVAAAALVVVILEFRRRVTLPAGRSAPVPRQEPVSGAETPSPTYPPGISGGDPASA